MAIMIERTFVDVGGRSVHIRRAGKGQPLFLFHQSPKTSEELVPLIEALADRYHVIAPDTPGYGLSDPLPIKRPSMTDLADGAAALMDALGIAKAYIYGIHTGAKIALGLAARHPSRVAAVIANGVLVNTKADRQDLAARYLPAFEPKDDGSHLIAGWHRMREQRVFFPWYNRQDAARMPISVGDPQSLNYAFMDFLAAGETYTKAYGAALGLNIKGVLPLLSVPTLITCGPHDVLLEDVKRLKGSEQVTVEPAQDDAHLIELMKAHYSGVSDVEPLTWPVQKTAPRLLGPVMVGGMHGYRSSTKRGPRILVLPAPGGSVFLESEALAPLAPFAQLLALDPIGYGWSEKSGDSSTALSKAAKEFEPDYILTFGAGCHIGANLAKALGTSAGLICVDPFVPKSAKQAAQMIPDLTPVEGGGHIMQAWWAVREGRKFLPWTSPDHTHHIPSDGSLNAADVHAATIVLLGGWQAAKEQLGAAVGFELPDGATVVRSDWMLDHPEVMCTESAENQVIRPYEEDLAISLMSIVGLS